MFAEYAAALRPGSGQRGMKLGKYFNYAEFLKSNRAVSKKIANLPSDEHEGEVIANLRALVRNTLDPIRTHLGKPVTVTAGFRAPLLNNAIKGSTLCRGHGLPNDRAVFPDGSPDSETALRLGCGSQHMKGEGVDINVQGYTRPDGRGDSERLARDILKLKRRGLVDFDQLIWYAPDQSGHVHLSWSRKHAPKRDVKKKVKPGSHPRATKAGYVANLLPPGAPAPVA